MFNERAFVIKKMLNFHIELYGMSPDQAMRTILEILDIDIYRTVAISNETLIVTNNKVYFYLCTNRVGDFVEFQMRTSSQGCNHCYRYKIKDNTIDFASELRGHYFSIVESDVGPLRLRPS